MQIAAREQQILRIQEAGFHPPMNELLAQKLRADVLRTVQGVIEAALVEELLAERAKMNNPPRRSGYYTRILDSLYGRIEALRMPKLRKGNKEREWQILERYEKGLGGYLAYMSYLYVMGLSLRDLQMAMYFLLGDVLSTTSINRVTRKVQAQLDEERMRKIERPPIALIVDGVWVSVQYEQEGFKIDKAGHRRRQRQAEDRVILCALAVYEDASYHVLHYEIAKNEDEAAWKTMFAHLVERGLDAGEVQLIVSDGTKGLLAAMEEFMPNAQHQRCITHKVRGMERYLTYQNLSFLSEAGETLSKSEARALRWRQIKQDAYAIYEAPTRAEARSALTKFVNKWESVEPKAVHAFHWGIQRTFTFYDFDKELHSLIRTTNLVERFFREFRTRADEIGAFPNETSCLTLFFLVASFDHAKHDRFKVANTS